jgi:hypothetical protein
MKRFPKIAPPSSTATRLSKSDHKAFASILSAGLAISVVVMNTDDTQEKARLLVTFVLFYSVCFVVAILLLKWLEKHKDHKFLSVLWKS